MRNLLRHVSLYLIRMKTHRFLLILQDRTYTFGLTLLCVIRVSFLHFMVDLSFFIPKTVPVQTSRQFLYYSVFFDERNSRYRDLRGSQVRVSSHPSNREGIPPEDPSYSSLQLVIEVTFGHTILKYKHLQKTRSQFDKVYGREGSIEVLKKKKKKKSTLELTPSSNTNPSLNLEETWTLLRLRTKILLSDSFPSSLRSCSFLRKFC